MKNYQVFLLLQITYIIRIDSAFIYHPKKTHCTKTANFYR